MTISLLKEKENEPEQTLRPKTLKEFVGQEKLKQNLSIFIEAAKQRGEALEHVLFYGGAGLGKTTLANIIANEIGKKIHITAGPVLSRQGDLVALLTSLEDGEILFIDEVHRLHRSVEEVLYPAMEDYKVDLILGKGPGARTLRLDLPKFTLVGATTKASMLSSPLRDRFGSSYSLDFYPVEDLIKIIARSARILSIAIDEQASGEIAQRSRFTPRVANRLLKRVRDWAQVNNIKTISPEHAKESLEILDVDQEGLTAVDRKMLKMLAEHFNGGPVGLKSLAVACGEEPETLEEIYEPYLVRLGLLQRTPRGRMLSSSAMKRFGISGNRALF